MLFRFVEHAVREPHERFDVELPSRVGCSEDRGLELERADAALAGRLPASEIDLVAARREFDAMIANAAAKRVGS